MREERPVAEAMMAHPELRHPFDAKEIHPEGAATVLYQGRAITLREARMNGHLLIRPNDLAKVNGFELKPEGACHADTCIPIHHDMLDQDDTGSWFNLTAFAEHMDQAYVADEEHAVWSFAEMPSKRDSMLIDALAPDFEVKDRQGRMVSKDSLKGKKAMIVTWASW